MVKDLLQSAIAPSRSEKKVYIWPLKNRSDDMDHHRMA